MNKQPILFVAGLGRCGTTMAMHMLWRGGFPVAGLPPGFEVDQMHLGGVDKKWLIDQSGRAVKWIDPPNAIVSRSDLLVEPVIIVMARDVKEQAKSQIKMSRIMGAPVTADRNTLRAMTRSIVDDTTRMERQLWRLGGFYKIRFERVLAEPRTAAIEIASVVAVNFGINLDTCAMASVVLARRPECAPDLSIELAISAQHPESAQ